MKYSSFQGFLICPKCGSDVSPSGDAFQCQGCDSRYPVYFGVPVMTDPSNEAFRQEDFNTQAPPDIFFKQYKNPVVRFLKRVRPDVTLNVRSRKNYAAIAGMLAGKQDCRILVIGGSIDGTGIKALKEHLPKGTVLVESDVAHGPNTNIIIDAHQIPFRSGSFDLVVAQAVLEHVLDPFRCVSEIHRVLKEGGMVYAETPFMQQVHGGKYDFLRFTPLGHRRLFRHFVEKDAGIVAGAGSSLAWSIKFFITSFASGKKADKALSYISNFLAFWVKYFDYLLNHTKGSMDAGCGYFFLGEKKEGYTLSDKGLLASYPGLRY